jgi:hypothetical protein
MGSAPHTRQFGGAVAVTGTTGPESFAAGLAAQSHRATDLKNQTERR